MKFSLAVAQIALFGATFAKDVAPAAKKPLVYPEALMDDVKLAQLLAHEQQLQDFASQFPEMNRVFGSPAHNLSVYYLYNQLRSTGAYNVRLQEQEQLYFLSTQNMTINGREYSPQGAIYGVGGEVTAPVVNVNNLGCAASDFPGAVRNKVALISRGNCTFSDKIALAGNAGAAAAIVYNNVPGLLAGTLGTPTNPLGPYVPAVFIYRSPGLRLSRLVSQGRTQIADISVDVVTENRTTYNVLAETKGGDKNNVIVVGAHTDSVDAGPGINDNGSGTSAILAVAKALAHYTVTNAVRFGFWTAEEFGLLGSQFYVDSLSDADVDKIAMNLNFDMVASPNYVYSIYDGDGSAFNMTGPAGSAEIEHFFEQYYENRGTPHIPTAFDGRSDYGPFLARGVACGGLFTGAEEIKTERQAKLFGGTAGIQLDPCYHQACDTIDNLNSPAFILNARAIAYAVGTYGRSLAGFPGRETRVQARKSWSLTDAPSGLEARSLNEDALIPNPDRRNVRAPAA